MRTIHIHADDDTAECTMSALVPDEFAAVIEWLVMERVNYQGEKWDYQPDGLDFEHAKQGLTEHAWFWTRGVENYAGRVRLNQARDDAWWLNPVAIQAVLKLAATMACIPEHLLRGGAIESLPKPGLSSGNVT